MTQATRRSGRPGRAGVAELVMRKFIRHPADIPIEVNALEQESGAPPRMVNEKVNVTAVSHPDSIYAGAIGAALWGAFRHEKLNQLESRAAA